MENNRTVPDSYYDYADYNEYSNFRISSPMRNETLMPKVPPKPPTGNKLYYTGQDNFSDYYPEEQLWNMQTRRLPNSSYTAFQTPNQTANYQMNNPQAQNITKKSEMPHKGILLNGQMENGLEGQGRNGLTQQGNNTNPQHRPKSPMLNYRLPVYRNNEDLMAAFCGGEPVSEIDDDQYYLIHDDKIEQNYNTEKSMYEDFNLPTGNESSYKDPNAYEFNTPDNEAFYDTSLRELATLDLRERPSQVLPQQMYTNNNYGNPEGSTYETTDDDGYYMLSQSTVNRPPQAYSQNRYQNLTRNGNLKKPINRREVYKNVSEKLNETFTELKNAGVSDKKEEIRPRSRLAERYSLHGHPESGKKPVQKVQDDYHFDKMEYKDGESFTNRQYKYQDMIDENTNRSPRMSQLEKYKLTNHNELINPSLRFPSCQKQEVSSNLKKKIQMASEDQKIEKNTFLESGSFVHMHKEYSKNQSVPDCCVDVYNSYRKEKIPVNMLRIE